jgi:HEAT repeat protein
LNYELNSNFTNIIHPSSFDPNYILFFKVPFKSNHLKKEDSMRSQIRSIIAGITIMLCFFAFNGAWGGEGQKSKIPQKDIIGSWKTSNQLITLEFKPNGGFIYQEELKGEKNKIKKKIESDETPFTDANHLIGVWVIPPKIYEVRVYTDHLILKDKQGKEIQFLRVKQNATVTSIANKESDKNSKRKFPHEKTEKMINTHTKSTEPKDELPKLIQKSKHKDKNVRKDAIEELGDIRDPRAIEALVLALGDEDGQLRVQASMKLWDIGRPAVEPLIAALQGPLPKVYCKAAQTLGLIRDPRAIDPLIEALSYDKIFRWCAEQALLGIGKPAVERLTQELKSKNPNIKASAARILADMSPPAEEPLIEALQNGEIIVIGGAYKFYIKKGIKSSVPLLIEALNTSGDKSMAEAYLNSGNTKLSNAAIDWAKSHGYRVNSLPGYGGVGRAKWGKNQ